MRETKRRMQLSRRALGKENLPQNIPSQSQRAATKAAHHTLKAARDPTPKSLVRARTIVAPALEPDSQKPLTVSALEDSNGASTAAQMRACKKALTESQARNAVSAKELARLQHEMSTMRTKHGNLKARFQAFCYPRVDKKRGAQPVQAGGRAATQGAAVREVEAVPGERGAPC